MKFTKPGRGEKKPPKLPVIAASAGFIAVFLIALWFLSTPTDSPTGYKSTATKSTTEELIEEESVGKSIPEEKETTLPNNIESPPDVGTIEEAPVDLDQTDETVEKSPVKKEEKSDPMDEDVDEFQTKGEEPETLVEEDTEKAVIPDDEVVPVDKAELSVEKENAPTSSLITQGKESKEEKIQEVIKNAGTVDEKDIVDDLIEGEVPNTEEAKEDAMEIVDLIDEGKYDWKLCSWTGAQDYIPCLDNKKALKQLKSTKHFEHRERHCPVGEDLLTCLVPLPEGYKARISWPASRNQVWHANVPHDKLVSYKQDQNWVKKEEDHLIFPGGGTQFKNGALQYINSITKTWEEITWGEHIRTVLDVGCGVASFGGYMFDNDALTLSFAPKDEHEAQVQMALERGIPGLLSVMGTKRLTYPSNVFDVVHCARCRVPWHAEGGKLLLELNRILRPGGYFVWSATPVYRLKDPNEVELWKATKKVTDSICWKLLIRTKMDPESQIGMAIFQKPSDNACYEKRKEDEPPMCPSDDKPDAAWYVDMNSCLHRIPTGEGARATTWPAEWPARLETAPSWLSSVPKGIYGKPASKEFVTDTAHWKHVAEKSYLKSLGIDWKLIRNVMDMKAGYGGFAAALAGLPVWVMNVVPTDEPDTLPIIYDRGLFGLYHDWCESFSTYPRTYDLLHADHVFGSVKKRCSILTTVIEMDRILRPNGWAIFRDKLENVNEIEEIIKSLHWTVQYSYAKGAQRLLAAQKGMWRPKALV